MMKYQLNVDYTVQRPTLKYFAIIVGEGLQ